MIKLSSYVQLKHGLKYHDTFISFVISEYLKMRLHVNCIIKCQSIKTFISYSRKDLQSFLIFLEQSLELKKIMVVNDAELRLFPPLFLSGATAPGKRQYKPSYRMSKKSWPKLYSNLLYGQEVLTKFI